MRGIVGGLFDALAGCFFGMWDPDFTKVTEEEKHRIDIADKEMRSGIYFSEVDVWGE